MVIGGKLVVVGFQLTLLEVCDRVQHFVLFLFCFVLFCFVLFCCCKMELKRLKLQPLELHAYPLPVAQALLHWAGSSSSGPQRGWCLGSRASRRRMHEPQRRCHLHLHRHFNRRVSRFRPRCTFLALSTSNVCTGKSEGKKCC